MDRVAERPSPYESVESPGVVDQPARELDEDHDNKGTEQVDDLEGPTVKGSGHG